MKKYILILLAVVVLAGVAWWLFARPVAIPMNRPVGSTGLTEATALPEVAPETVGPEELSALDPERRSYEPISEDMPEESVSMDWLISPEGVDMMPALSPPNQLSRRVEQIQNDTLVSLEDYGRPMLTSTNPILRALGAILLSKVGALDQAVMAQIGADADIAVPFQVMEWLRDFGPADYAADLAAILNGRDMTVDELSDAILASRFSVGGGRIAVDQLNARLPPEERADALLEIAEEPSVAYDVRMRSLLRVGEGASSDPYRETLAQLKSEVPSEEDEWGQALTRLEDLLYDDEGGTLLPQDQVTNRDLDLILGNDYPTVVRDAALYLEDRLMKSGVTVEPGSANIVGDFIKEFPDRDDEWNVEDEEPFQRLIALRTRLEALEPPGEPLPDLPAGYDPSEEHVR